MPASIPSCCSFWSAIGVAVRIGVSLPGCANGDSKTLTLTLVLTPTLIRPDTDATLTLTVTPSPAMCRHQDRAPAQRDPPQPRHRTDAVRSAPSPPCIPGSETLARKPEETSVVRFPTHAGQPVVNSLVNMTKPESMVPQQTIKKHLMTHTAVAMHDPCDLRSDLTQNQRTMSFIHYVSMCADIVSDVDDKVLQQAQLVAAGVYQLLSMAQWVGSNHSKDRASSVQPVRTRT